MPKNTDKIIEPIDASIDEVVEVVIEGATPNPAKINALSTKPEVEGATQLFLNLGIEIEKNINGIEMGVLENGIAYLCQRGLQRILGVNRKKLFDITNEWEECYRNGVWDKPRISFIASRLEESQYREPSLYIPIIKGGKPHYAYPDVVCMAILEYYAFETQDPIETAVSSYRKFARYGLQKFIYEAVGYRPSNSWKYFHDRTSILKDASPDGHFIVYNEISSMIVDVITAGLPVNDKIIPDISVGQTWAKYWNESELDNKYGKRIPYEHNYPDYYPQSLSNPQPAWAYPDSALAEFRRWFRHEYLTTKFPKYILNKARMLKGGREEAQQIAVIYDVKQLNK